MQSFFVARQDFSGQNERMPNRAEQPDACAVRSGPADSRPTCRAWWKDCLIALGGGVLMAFAFRAVAERHHAEARFRDGVDIRNGVVLRQFLVDSRSGICFWHSAGHFYGGGFLAAHGAVFLFAGAVGAGGGQLVEAATGAGARGS